MTAKAGVPRDALITLAATISIFLIGGIFHALADLSGAYKTSPKVAETPAASAVSTPTTSEPSESATPTAPTVETTATPSATSAAATPTPETTEPSASEPAATPTTAAITDAAKLEELNKTLSEKIKQNWQQPNPTFTEELIYIVKVNSAGAIVGYESKNQPASEYFKDTPLAGLIEPADTKEPLANFQVVFTPTGEVQITPASQE